VESVLRFRPALLQRQITAQHASLVGFAPGGPMGKWFKRFAGVTACGEGQLVKTFLRAAARIWDQCAID
jgi:hypothetical protein